MSLTDTALESIKPIDKPQKLFDGNGLLSHFGRVTPQL
jgi:hypothetical protein